MSNNIKNSQRKFIQQTVIAGTACFCGNIQRQSKCKFAQSYVTTYN